MNSQGLPFLPTRVIGSHSFPRWPDHTRELGSKGILTPEVVADRIRQALKYIPAEKMAIVPDCGMKFMPRERAFGKLKAMVEGTRIVRRELGVV